MSPGADAAPGEMLVETTECEDCGRHFVGTYCPECGTATGEPRSILRVASTFFAEVLDVRKGLWATLKALTLRPGSALRQYLGEGPRLLMNPGRYLLAAIVVNFASVQALTWVGARRPASDRFSVDVEDLSGQPEGEEERQVLDAISALVEDLQRAFASETYYIVSSILLAGLLGLVFWRLFRGAFRHGAQALVLSAFVVGHAVFLETALRLLHVPTVFFATGQRARLPTWLTTGIVVLCATVAAWRTFGPGYRAAVKGAGAALWASLEQFLIGGIAIGGYSLWVIRSRIQDAEGAEGTLSLSVSEGGGTIVSVALRFALVMALPLVLHACAEAYYRLRER